LSLSESFDRSILLFCSREELGESMAMIFFRLVFEGKMLAVV
jgi:hypothetical protein